MEFYLAQAVSILTGIVAVVMIQFTSMKKILVGQIVVNLLSALSYILLGGLSGAGICIIAILQSVTMFFFNIKGISPHKAVIYGFVALYIGCSAYYYQSFIDIFSGISAVCYAFSVVQTKPALSRLWYLFNPLFWLVYDIYTRAYGNFIIHLAIFVSTLFAIFRNDVKKKEA